MIELDSRSVMQKLQMLVCVQAARAAYCCFALLLLGAASAQPADPPKWEAMRVFIPNDETQISRIVSPFFEGVPIDELEAALKAEDEKRKRALLQVNSVGEAIYVARLENDSLFSNQSRWTFASSETKQIVQLGKTSLALRNARGLAVDKSQLLEEAQFSIRGEMQVNVIGEAPQRWFGFASVANGYSLRKRFGIQVPLARKALMLVATDNQMQLSSPDVVVETISRPQAALPVDWPNETALSESDNWRWWLVHLSGVSQFELIAEPTVEADLSDFQHVIRTCRVNHCVFAGRVETEARFTIADKRREAPLHLRVGSDVKVEKVLIDDEPVAWRVLPEKADEYVVLEFLNPPLLNSGAVLAVTALTFVDTSRQVAFPEIAVEKSFCLDGLTRLYGTDGLVTDEVEAVGGSLARLPTDEALFGVEIDEIEPLCWNISWVGSPPAAIASFAKTRQTWTSQSLTRIGIQSEWISAQCSMRIESDAVNSNELRLVVGNNWFVDSVKLLQATADFRARVVDREEAQNPVIVINWEGARDSVSIQLDVVAHSPRDTHAEDISLRSPRLVSLPGADQIDNYVIEPSSRFDVQLNSSLLRYQLDANNLPDWQRKLLPELSELWLFQGVRNAIPPIQLSASGGTYASKVITIVREKSSGYELETTINCRPILGSIDRLDIALPKAVDGETLTWELMQPDSPTNVPLQMEAMGASESLLDLELPGAFNSPFAIRAIKPISVDSQDKFNIPIVGMPAAASGESILILPSSLANPLSQTGIELLPPSACCSASEIVEILGGDADQVTNLVAARVETGVSQLIELQSLPRAAGSAWVRREAIAHRLHDSGQVEHTILWVLENSVTANFEVQLPRNWRVHTVFFDGIRRDIEVDDQGQLIFELPAFSRSVLELHCSSRRPRRAWFSQDRLGKPTISSPVFERSETVWMSPSRIAVGFANKANVGSVRKPFLPPLAFASKFFAASSPTPIDDGAFGESSDQLIRLASDSESKLRLADRLLPSAWWNLLAPDRTTTAYPSRLSSGWSSIQFDGDKPETKIWTIHRNALAALAIATCLVCGGLWWISLRSSPVRWWSSLATVSVLAVLCPIGLLPYVQLALLGLVCAALLRLVVFVTQVKTQASGSVIAGPVSNASRFSPLLFALVLPLSLPCSSLAQSILSEDFATASGKESAQVDSAATEIFGVLIPLDKNGKAGPIAYAPKKLMQLLEADQATPSISGPQILGIEYTLRTRRNLVTQVDQIQEFLVEVRVLASSLDSQLVLPFNNSELTLVRGSSLGQELLVGGRNLYQLPDAVVFQPKAVGAVRLQLQFEVRQVIQADGESKFRCQLPPIPSATLRLLAESGTTFQLATAGGGVKSASSGSTELLGPSEVLEISWSSNLLRNVGVQQPVEIQADTWMHCRGSQIAAICQINIRNGRSLPRELRMVGEPDWEPVGMDWGDGELVASTMSPLGGRRLFTVRCTENLDDQTGRVLRVCMVPSGDRDDSVKAVPFLTLQEFSQQAVTRTLAWSSESQPKWRPDGLDFWQEIPGRSSADWGDLQWNAQPTTFRIPFGNMASSIRRLPLADRQKVEEVTQVHLGASECQVTYQAQFRSSKDPTLSLIMPLRARVNSVLIDGQVPDYRVSERERHAVLDIVPERWLANAQAIEVQVTLPLSFGVAARLPRMHLRNFDAGSSIYRVLAGAGLDCQIQNNSPLKFELVNARPLELLSKLESLVGQVDLGNSNRGTAQLPVHFQLQRPSAPPLSSAVLYLDRIDQVWSARLVARWANGDKPLDFVFLELPSSVRDSVQTGQMPAQMVPVGGSGRMTLRLIPPPPVDGQTQIDVSFQLPALASSQSVVVPKVALLESTPILPVLALPAKLDGRPLTWLQTGKRLEDNLTGLEGAKSTEPDYQFFDLKGCQSQVSFSLQEDDPQRAELLLAQVTLLEREGDHILGKAEYWIQPGGQLNLPIQLPEQCTVLGVEIGKRAAIWRNENSELSVLLQPNFLPVNVRLLLHWKATDKRTLELALPNVMLAKRSPRFLTSVDNRIVDYRVLTANIEPEQNVSRGLIVNRWAELLFSSLPATNGYEPSEIATWLHQWHPSAMGFDGSETISLVTQSRQPNSPTPDALNGFLSLQSNEGEAPNVQLLWMYLCQQVGTNEQATDAGNDAAGWQAPSDVNVSVGPQVALRDPVKSIGLERLQEESALWAQVLSAVFIAMAFGLTFWLAKRFSANYMKLLSSQPWVFWLQLSALCWFLIPIAWPSYVLGLSALFMLCSQTLERRRRARMLSRA